MMKTKPKSALSSWGNFPKVANQAVAFNTEQQLVDFVKQPQTEQNICYGNGRSYGDSALSQTIIHRRTNDLFIDFNEQSGLLRCQAGVTLDEIIKAFMPRGWFLKVTPGTKYITVGGAVAADVHGKNHHIDGCFSNCVQSIRLLQADGSIVQCSKTHNRELFEASCGGMGLTGVILDVSFYLKRVNSIHIEQTLVKNDNLKQTFEAFEQYREQPYSVAWIDCLAGDENLGRSLLTVGDFADDGVLQPKPEKKLSVPFFLPGAVLNKWSIKAFNLLYFHKVRKRTSRQKVSFNSFFYPLDNINNWNRMYGRKGFVQYQFILPKAVSFAGLQQILQTISQSGMASFLAVLKLYGPSNANWLSFPLEGYSLALDFKIQTGLFELLDRLDQMVLKYQGRIYLAKDSRVSKAVFEQGYPNIERFRSLRKERQMTAKFNSAQSNRLGI